MKAGQVRPVRTRTVSGGGACFVHSLCLGPKGIKKEKERGVKGHGEEDAFPHGRPPVLQKSGKTVGGLTRGFPQTAWGLHLSPFIPQWPRPPSTGTLPSQPGTALWLRCPHPGLPPLAQCSPLTSQPPGGGGVFIRHDPDHPSPRAKPASSLPGRDAFGYK